MPESSFQGSYLRFLADCGSICHFIVVGDDLDVLFCAYSTSERFYELVNTLRTSSTTIKKMKTVFGFHFGGFANENRGRFSFFTLDIDFIIHILCSCFQLRR